MDRLSYLPLFAYRDFLRNILLDLLLLFSLFMAPGLLFRFFGHGTDFGFTPDYSLKWFQSLAYLSGAVSLIFAAKKMLTLFRGKDG